MCDWCDQIEVIVIVIGSTIRIRYTLGKYWHRFYFLYRYCRLSVIRLSLSSVPVCCHSISANWKLKTENCMHKGICHCQTRVKACVSLRAARCLPIYMEEWIGIANVYPKCGERMLNRIPFAYIYSHRFQVLSLSHIDTHSHTTTTSSTAENFADM